MADSDYMRKRDDLPRARPFGPPEPTAGLTVWIVFGILGASCGGYQAWLWLKKSADQTKPVATHQQSVKQPQHRIDRPKNVERVPTMIDHGSAHMVSKCVVNGVTLYADSAAACAANSGHKQVLIDLNQNLSDGLRAPPPTVWAPAVVQAPLADAPGAYVDPNIQKKATCLAYEEQIKAIDARARQPLSGWEQDELAAKRKKARDEQFRLRC